MANVSIINGTTFTGNRAFYNGGAINFYCSSNFNFDMSKCTLKIDNTIFVYNLAGNEGGAVKWNIFEPSMTNI